jgi:hypothetical protein
MLIFAPEYFIFMKKRVERTRGAGTLTEAAFFSGIRNALRQKSRWWKPISIVKNKARRKYNGPNKRQKFEYQCNQCKNWFPDKRTTVDHIIPAGSLRCFADLPGFVERLFVEVPGLQLLCDTCHTLKTKSERDAKSINPKETLVSGRTIIKSGGRRKKRRTTKFTRKPRKNG